MYNELIMRRIIFSKKFIFGSLIVVAIIGGILFRQNIINKQNGDVEKAEVKRGTVKEELILSGNIKAGEHINLQFAVSGLLTWVGVTEGDTVKKGQSIASLDTRILKKTLH